MSSRVRWPHVVTRDARRRDHLHCISTRDAVQQRRGGRALDVHRFGGRGCGGAERDRSLIISRSNWAIHSRTLMTSRHMEEAMWKEDWSGFGCDRQWLLFLLQQILVPCGDLGRGDVGQVRLQQD